MRYLFKTLSLGVVGPILFLPICLAGSSVPVVFVASRSLRHWLQMEACPAFSETDPVLVGGSLLKRDFLEKLTIWKISQSTPGRIRTCDLLIRSQLLYPAELRGHIEELPSGTSVDEFDNPKVYLFAVFLSRIVSFGAENPYN